MTQPFFCLGRLYTSRDMLQTLGTNFPIIVSTLDASVWLVHDAWSPVDRDGESEEDVFPDEPDAYNFRPDAGWLRGLPGPLFIAKLADNVHTWPLGEEFILPLEKAVVSSVVVAAFVCTRVIDGRPVPPSVTSNLPLGSL